MFFHHGHARGGAPVSLLFLLRQLKLHGVDSDLVDTVCMPEVVDLYQGVCRNVISQRIWYYPHSSLCWLDFSSIRDVLRNLKWLLLYPWACLKVFRCLRGKEYDIVHFNSATLILYGWIPKLLGLRLICHIREPFVRGHFGLRRMILRSCLRIFPDHCIAICEDNADDTKLSSDRVTVVYNPVDFDQFDCLTVEKEVSRRALGVSQNAFVALFAGGSNATVKGVSDFLKAMDAVSQQIPDLVCLMPSFEESRLDGASAQLCLRRLDDRIIKSDFVRDIEKWISASDAIYALHQIPHFSRTVMEAGAMKRAVVATDIAGISEVVSDEGNGLLCPVGEVDAIVRATLRLHDNPALALRLGDGGYEQAFRLFRAEAHGDHVMDIYRSVMGERC